jgi:hypothetical protein
MTVNPSITKFGLDENFNLQLARGQIYNHFHVFKYGFNGAVGANAEHIWFNSGTYTWSPAASTLSITSSDAADDSPAGTGALTVRVEGLDANHDEITEDVVLNGTAVVNTNKLFLRTHRIYVLTAGTTLTNEGVIYATDTGDTYTTPGIPNTATLVRSTIGIGEGQTLQAFYTVPAGHTAYMTNITASSGDGVNASVVSLKARTVGGAFRTKNKFVIFKGTYPINYDVPLVFIEKTDIEVTATGNASATDVGASFDLILVKN